MSLLQRHYEQTLPGLASRMRTALNLELEEEATNREEALHPAPPPLTDSQFRRFLNKVGSIPGNCVVLWHGSGSGSYFRWLQMKKKLFLQISSAIYGAFKCFLNSVSCYFFRYQYIKRFLLFYRDLKLFSFHTIITSPLPVDLDFCFLCSLVLCSLGNEYSLVWWDISCGQVGQVVSPREFRLAVYRGGLESSLRYGNLMYKHQS